MNLNEFLLHVFHLWRRATFENNATCMLFRDSNSRSYIELRKVGVVAWTCWLWVITKVHIEQLGNVFILFFLGISRLVEEGVYCAAYPLHVVSFYNYELLLREKLSLFWLNKRNYTQLSDSDGESAIEQASVSKWGYVLQLASFWELEFLELGNGLFKSNFLLLRLFKECNFFSISFK